MYLTRKTGEGGEREERSEVDEAWKSKCRVGWMLNVILDTYYFKRKEAFVIYIVPRTKKKKLDSVGNCEDVIYGLA